VRQARLDDVESLTQMLARSFDDDPLMTWMFPHPCLLYTSVRELNALGLHCVLLTGDNEATALAVASSIGVSDVVADALPADKVEYLRRLQKAGRSVAMVGDGVNDCLLYTSRCV